MKTRAEEGYQQRFVLLVATGIKIFGLEQSGAHVYIPDPRLAPYLGELVEYGVVVDRRMLASHPLRNRWELDSPLPGLKSSRCPDPGAASQVLGGICPPMLRTPLIALAGTQEPPRWEGLDYADPLEYAQWWERRGARIGARSLAAGESWPNGVIRWADGRKTPVPDYRQRWRKEP